MKRQFHFMLAVILIITLAACGKQAGTESSVEKKMEDNAMTDNHIQENTELFDFELTEDEMQRINALDRGEKHDWY